jgi:hypothetical protein
MRPQPRVQCVGSTRVSHHGHTGKRPAFPTRRKLADIVLLFEGDDRSAAEIAEAALEKLDI